MGCLDVLSDDLLTHILRFAPAKDAVSTSALSRRWRSLWRSTGAVNLETRIPDDGFPSRAGYVPSICDLSVDSLPSDTLRVLELAGCSALTPPHSGAAVAFPRLESLRLRYCALPLDHLQAVIDAAPALADIHLDSVFLADKRMDKGSPTPPEGYLPRLSCPAAATLVLHRCRCPGNVGLEVHAPRLQHFSYHAHLRQFRLTSSSRPLASVDLHFFPYRGHYREERDTPGERLRFWRFLHNFRHAKVMELRMNYLEDIAVISQAKQARLLCDFGNLQQLELEAVHRPKSETAALAIANLLNCCPKFTDLHIKLSTAQSQASKKCDYGSTFLERKFPHDREKSVNSYKRRRLERHLMVSLLDGVAYDEVSGIPGLSGCSFECLQSSLKKVILRFRPEKDCFGVKLVKFFF